MCMQCIARLQYYCLHKFLQYRYRVPAKLQYYCDITISPSTIWESLDICSSWYLLKCILYSGWRVHWLLAVRWKQVHCRLPSHSEANFPTATPGVYLHMYPVCNLQTSYHKTNDSIVPVAVVLSCKRTYTYTAVVRSTVQLVQVVYLNNIPWQCVPDVSPPIQWPIVRPQCANGVPHTGARVAPQHGSAARKSTAKTMSGRYVCILWRRYVEAPSVFFMYVMLFFCLPPLVQTSQKAKLSSNPLDTCSTCKLVAQVLKGFIDNNKTEVHSVVCTQWLH